MKTLTLTSEFFQNECSKSFLKAIQGNTLLDVKNPYDPNYFIASYYKMFVCTNLYNWSDSGLIKHESITFKLDDSFSVDWACLLGQNIKVYSTDDVGGEYVTNMRQYDSIRYASNLKLDLSYLATLQGVIIEEAGE